MPCSGDGMPLGFPGADYIPFTDEKSTPNRYLICTGQSNNMWRCHQQKAKRQATVGISEGRKHVAARADRLLQNLFEGGYQNIK